MANAVKEVCDNNPDVVALVPAFVVLVVALGTRITTLRAQMKKVSMKNSGLYENKTNWKESLSLLLSVLCGAGVSYARKISDVVLRNNFDYPVSTFTEMRDTELIEMAQSLIELQATVAAPLVDYGITTAFMTEVGEALDNFDEANPQPITNVYTMEAERELLLKMAFSLSDFVLQDMMKAALIYKVLNPTFYQSLHNASLIRNAGLRHEEEPATAAAKEVATGASGQQASTTERKEAQESPNMQEVLKGAMDTIRTNGEEVAAEPTAVQEPSLNGQ